MHYAETSRQNKTTCSHEHQEEKQCSKRTATSYMQNNNPKMTCDSAIGQHLITDPECAKTFPDDNFRIVGQARSSFHISVLESVYIKTQNPTLCKRKDFISSLGLFK